MTFKYSCFVSYRHGRKRLMKQFMDQLIQALEDYVEPYLDLPIFHDRGELEGGDLYNEQFAYALSRSVCMIAVYTPTYFDRIKTYCAREYRAMEIIEESRFRVIQSEDLKRRGLIIPVIMKGLPPGYITTRRACKYDFGRFTLQSDDISRHDQYAEWFDEIGQRIRAIHDAAGAEMADVVAAGVQDFVMPSESDIQPLLDEIIPRVRPIFPGHSQISARPEAHHGI